jgi:hypothetical protein
VEFPKIAVFPAREFERRRHMLQTLGRLFGVEFVPADSVALRSYKLAWLFATTRQEARDIANDGIRCLTFYSGQAEPIRDISAEVELGNVQGIEKCLRGRRLPDCSVERSTHLEIFPGDEILARKGDSVLWLRWKAGGAVVDLAAIDLPELSESEYLFRSFCSEKWAGLLPAVHFLKEVSPWTLPPHRACFMFDDPNLHWTSFGYANYRELARDAQTHNYHASFATVPLDAWYVNQRAAAIFRENPRHLSFLIHGNNHTRFELSQTMTEERRLALAGQAIHRIERLEQVSGLKVPRVMAAPHGACNNEMATALLRSGFEAACISRGSIMFRNPDVRWPGTIGLTSAEFLGAGLPTIPRFNIQRDESYILFAAFLGQPIIPFGHADDLVEGLSLLRRLAALINSVGEVQWTDLETIMRSNYWTLLDGDILHVRMYSRKINLKVPGRANYLCIHRPWLGGSNNELIAFHQNSTGAGTIHSSFENIIPVVPGDEMLVTSVYPSSLNHEAIRFGRTPLWAIFRRQLCEGRDRLRPFKDKLHFQRKTKSGP